MIFECRRFNELEELQIASAVIWCLPRCVCLTSVVTLFRTGPMANKKSAMNERTNG